jgi:hypothetical protein
LGSDAVAGVPAEAAVHASNSIKKRGTNMDHTDLHNVSRFIGHSSGRRVLSAED